jgi:hypothetical protein
LLKEFAARLAEKEAEARPAAPEPLEPKEIAAGEAAGRREMVLRAKLLREARELEALAMAFLSLVPEEHRDAAYTAAVLARSAFAAEGAAESRLVTEADLRELLADAAELVRGFRAEYLKLAPPGLGC